MSTSSALEQTTAALAESRRRSWWLQERAAGRGAEIGREAELAAHQLALLRVRALRELRAAIEHHAREIDLAHARMVETLAELSRRLAQIAAEADFSPPPLPPGLERTVELRLTETRELALRIGSRRTPPG